MLFLTVICAWVFFLPWATPMMDDDILYDISWQSELMTPIDPENEFLFVTKRKEKYACILPTPQKSFSRSMNSVLASEVEPLLAQVYAKKMCTYRFDPYWIYEFCHGTHIRQYHETKSAGKRAVVQEYFLGYYRAENQESFTNADNQQVFKIHHKKINDRDVPMLAVRYTDGTKCDINSDRPRETTIFYVCHEKGHEGIFHFHEVSTCYYEMIVASPWLCKIPAFSPAEADRYSIDCVPRDNAHSKPLPLKKLQKEHKQSMNAGGGAQFTMSSADGTTFMVSYDYAKDRPVDDLSKIIQFELHNEQTPPATSPPPPSQTPPESIQPIDRRFLEEFFSGQHCLTGGSGWWRFEICYGKHVIQFHDEGERRTSITLGKWNRDKHIEWFRTNGKRKPSGTRKDRQYVSLFYTDGDTCPTTTNVPRTVEVKLRCAKRIDSSPVTSIYLVEPDTCAYILGIESPLFCNLSNTIDDNGIPNPDLLAKSIPED